MAQFRTLRPTVGRSVTHQPYSHPGILVKSISSLPRPHSCVLSSPIRVIVLLITHVVVDPCPLRIVPNPEYSPDCELSAHLFLNIICHLSLTTININKPGVLRFPQQSVPIVSKGHPNGHLKIICASHHHKCMCIPSTTAHLQDHFSHCFYLLPQDLSWSPANISDCPLSFPLWSPSPQ
jgi:hypothetical protein